MDYQLSRRVTHHYRDSWSYLDRWEAVGTGKMIAAYRETSADVGLIDDEDYCWRPGSVLRIVVTRFKGVTDKDVEHALRATFSGSSCTHEYDCCGCVSDWVRTVVKIDREEDEWLVTIARSANY